MLLLRLLCCILYTIYPVSADQELDQQCTDNCSCCIDKLCGEAQGFSDFCLKGCIDGHYGARCYKLCKYEHCKSCGHTSTIRTCTECYDGYYLGSNKDCTSQCPSNCKSCTSSAMCTECKEGFHDVNGSTTCKYAKCPTNCECIGGQGDCVSCKNGYYNRSSSCYVNEQKGDDDVTDTTSAILGCLLALAIIILTVENVFLLLSKRRKTVLRETSRQQPDVSYVNQLTSSVPYFPQDNETNPVSANQTAVYEEINRAHDADHEYQKICTIKLTPEGHGKY